MAAGVHMAARVKEVRVADALCKPDRGEAPLITGFGLALAVRPPLDSARLGLR